MDSIRILELAGLQPEYIKEFKEDLQKQCVMIMGLPAAGKSTFINGGNMAKYVPRMRNYKVTNSDTLLKGLQYKKAKEHFEYLKNNVKTEKELRDFSKSTTYKNPWTGQMSMVPITWAWWKHEMDNPNLRTYWNKFFKSYYATYFDVRDQAQAGEEKLFHTKIKESGGMLIIDTTGSNIPKAESRFKEAHDEGFNTVVVYLEIDPELSIARDEFRKKTEGRGVGEAVILGYAKKIDTAFNSYKQEFNKKDGYVDRILHFKWSGGSNPKSGTYNLVKDYRKHK